MSNKQSSVEWLFDHMVGLCEDYDDGKINYTKYCDGVKKAIELAKAMHNKEHGNTWDASMNNFKARGRKIIIVEDFDEYYNLTYGGNNGK